MRYISWIIEKEAEAQTDLFDRQQELPIEKDDDSDRFDLSSLDMSEFIIPEGEVDTRFKLINLLLKEYPDRTKEGIIDEVLSMPTGYSFENGLKQYMDVFPELRATIPEYLPPEQQRLPGTEPRPRFLPDPKQTEEMLEEYEKEKEIYESAVEEFKVEFEEKNDREPRSWEIVGVGSEPKKIQVYDLKITPQKYNELEKKLLEVYRDVNTKSELLSNLVLSSQEALGPEPSEPNYESFSTLNDYIQDLKERIIYESNNVLVNSAGYSIFGATTGHEYWGQRNSVKGFFKHQAADWQDDPEAMADYIEKTPVFPYERSYYYGGVSVDGWFNEKRNSLHSYSESLDKATDSYKRGLRFLKRLRRDLDKEINSRLESYPEKKVKYIETEFKDELDLIHKRILISLNNQEDTASRYSYYGHVGGFSTSNMYAETYAEKTEKALDLFDINLLFHNKIKMYEVIDNFATLIFALVNTALREVDESYIAPAIEIVAEEVLAKMTNDALGYGKEQLITRPDDTGYSNYKTVPNVSSDQLSEVADNWLAFSKGGAADYRSVIVYPNFIIKDKSIKKLVSKNIKRRVGFGLIKLFAMDTTLSRVFKNTVGKLIGVNNSKIKISGSNPEDIAEGIRKQGFDLIYNTCKKELIDKYNSTILSDYGYMNKTITKHMAKAFNINEDYKELTSILEVGIESMGRDDIYSEDAPQYILTALFSEEPKQRVSRGTLTDLRATALVKSLLFLVKKYEDFRYKFVTELNLKRNKEAIEINEKQLKISTSDRLFLRQYGIENILGEPRDFLKQFRRFPEIEFQLFYKLATGEGGYRTNPDDWDKEQIITLHNEYTEGRDEVNALIITFLRNIHKAADQFKALCYTSHYMVAFDRRMSTMGTVGPRAIAKRYSQLGTKLRAKDLPYDKLVGKWTDEFINKINTNVEEFAIKKADDLEQVVDDANLFYASANRGMQSMRADYAAAIMICKKFGVENHQEFISIMDKCSSSYERYANFGYAEIKRFVPMIFDNKDNLEKKIKDLYKISIFAHNIGLGLPDSFFKRMIKDPNLKDLNKNATVTKYFSMCVRLTRLGGLATIRRKHKDVIDRLIACRMISRGFYTRLRKAYRICRTGLRIRPNLEGLEEDVLREQEGVRKLMETIDTELGAVEDFDALNEYNEQTLPKDKKLYNLDWEVKRKSFRFRVLQTYDPYHFKVGIDSGCCQRLGGYGEAAAIDSYINPLAGVLLLEIFLDGGWKMACQSYFHYVPSGNGYILDNVEHDYRIDNKVSYTTGYSTEELYAMLASRTDANFNIEYFLSGKGYSKLDTDDFKKKSLGYDPRDFAHDEKYTDWKSRSSLDLLRPKFNLPKIPKNKKDKKRKARLELLQKLIKTSQLSFPELRTNSIHAHVA